MPRNNFDHRRQAAVGKIILTLVATAAVAYVLVGFLLGALDDAFQGFLP